jgi:hypothetical protein
MRGCIFLGVYIFGFTYTGEESARVFQYAICYETSPDHLMKTSLLCAIWKQSMGIEKEAFGIFPKKTSRFVGK